MEEEFNMVMADGTVILSKEERKQRRKDYKNADFVAQMSQALKELQSMGIALDATVDDLVAIAH